MPLQFLCPGTPLTAAPKTFIDGLDRVKELGLDGEEIQFGRGIFLKEPAFAKTEEKLTQLDLAATIHAPYYINLNAKERAKIHAGRHYILQTARIGHTIGAKSICFHPAYRFENNSAEIINTVRESLELINQTLIDEGIAIDVRPETGGKKAQFGTTEELIAVCEGLEHIKPCIDFAHLMATSNGVINSYETFCQQLDLIKSNLGNDALYDMHIHAGSVSFSDKGEIKALTLDDPQSQFKYQELLQALIDYNVEGWVIAETPSIEEGALLLRQTYQLLQEKK
jgi:deoxyribonuclease-4